MQKPHAQIIRHPSGQWAAIAAVPIGSGVYTFYETVDERPIREEVNAKVASFFGPTLRSQGVSVAGEPTSDMYAGTIAMARRAAEAMVNPAVRQQLLGKLGAKIRAAADFAEQLYARSSIAPGVNGFAPVVAVAGSIGGFSPNELLHVAVGQTICQIAGGSQSALEGVLVQARRVPADDRATKFLQELIMHAIGTPVAQILYNVFIQQGLQKFAQVILMATQAPQPQRAR